MDRREFLTVAGIGATAMTAGCLGSDGDIETGRVSVGGTGEESEWLKNGAVVEVEGGTMRVTATEIQRSLVSPLNDNAVYEPEGGQFLLVQVETDSNRWGRPGQFLELEVDGTQLDPETGIPPRVYLNQSRTDIAFGVRSVGSTLAQIQFPHEHRPHWEVPESLVEQFDVAPEFHLLSAAIGEQDGETVLDLTVENRGERAGVFRCTTATRGSEDIPELALFTVPAGEQMTATITNSTVTAWDPTDSFSHDIDPDTRAFAVD